MNPEPTALDQRRTVLILSDQFPPATLGGGPSRSLGAMVAGARHPQQVHVVTRDTDHTADQPMDVPRDRWTSYHDAAVWYGSITPAWRIAPTLMKARARRPDVLYLNSVFSWRFSIVPLLLRKLGFWGNAQVVLAPRGELDPGALAIRAPKKRGYLLFATLTRLFSGIVWHASAPLEADHIRSLIATPEIVIKENETDLPSTAARGSRQPGDVVQLVCPGRISPKKQIELLIAALADPRTSRRYQLTVAGGCDDPKYLAQLQRSAHSLGSRVRWTGALARHDLFAVLDASDAACFPTAGENFGHAIAESLSRSKPVLVADVTPWTEVVAQGGGIVVSDHSHEGWVAALDQLLRGIDLPARSAQAGAAYERWRSTTSSRSFLDYLVEDRLRELIGNE